MANDLEKIRFRFQEELALKNSLTAVGELVLEYAVKVTEAKSAVFLYAAPGSRYFERVAVLGLTPVETENWSKLARDAHLPLLEAIRSQKSIEVGQAGLIEQLTFPLNDAQIASAGFSVSFSPKQKVSSESRDFLFWISRLAEKSIFNKDAEGV